MDLQVSAKLFGSIRNKECNKLIIYLGNQYMIFGDDNPARTPVEYTLRFVQTDEQHLIENLLALIP